MSLTLRRTKGSQLTWDEVDANWTAGRTFDGTVLLGGEATAWDDLLMPLVQGKQGQTDKPAWDATNLGYLFPQNDATQIIYLNCQIPHRWKVGSVIYPHVHFDQSVNATPVFKIDYKWSSIGAAVPAGWTTYTMDTLVKPYTSGTIHNIVNNATGIDGTGNGISSMLQMKLYRQDNVYTGNCLATSFDIHIEIDSFGSDTEYSK
jgi:hypothetical protein